MGKAKPVPISLPADLLALAETRADALGLSRSGYVQQLIRADNGSRLLHRLKCRPVANELRVSLDVLLRRLVFHRQNVLPVL